MKPSLSTPPPSTDLLAIAAARVLLKFGTANPDWSEWRALRDALLKVKPLLGSEAGKTVGQACSTFTEAMREVYPDSRS
jgi:hypothetical protein